MEASKLAFLCMHSENMAETRLLRYQIPKEKILFCLRQITVTEHDGDGSL